MLDDYATVLVFIVLGAVTVAAGLFDLEPPPPALLDQIFLGDDDDDELDELV